MRHHRRRPPDPIPLTALQQQRLDGWIAMLDVDLDLAQATFRTHGDRTLPMPPIALEAVVRDGVTLAPAVEAAALGASSEPAPVRGLRGAYARRATHATVTPVNSPTDWSS